MARMTPGALAGDLSGSLGSLTVHRGPYGLQVGRKCRRRVAGGDWERAVRSEFSRARRDWLGLASGSRVAWRLYGGGEDAGFGAFWRTRIGDILFGLTPSNALPMGTPPAAVASLGVSCDVSAARLMISWTPTPLDPDVGLRVDGVVFRGIGDRAGYRGLRMWFPIVAGAASPAELWMYWGSWFGKLAVGQSIGIRVIPFDTVRRLWGAPMIARCIVTA